MKHLLALTLVTMGQELSSKVPCAYHPLLPSSLSAEIPLPSLPRLRQVQLLKTIVSAPLETSRLDHQPATGAGSGPLSLGPSQNQGPAQPEGSSQEVLPSPLGLCVWLAVSHACSSSAQSYIC